MLNVREWAGWPCNTSAATGQPGRQRALLRRLSAPVLAVHADVRLPPGRLGAREEATPEAARAGELRLTYARVNPGIRKYALPESTSAPSGSTGISYLWIQELSRAERSFVHRLDLAGRARTSTRTRCLSTPSVLISLCLSCSSSTLGAHISSSGAGADAGSARTTCIALPLGAVACRGWRLACAAARR